MTPTLKHFLERLTVLDLTPAYEFVPSKWIDTSQSSPSLVIAAKNELVGALTVYDDGDEVTIEIGQLHHTHFSAYNYDFRSSEQRMVAAARDAAGFVADVFADRVYFAVDFSGERCIGSSHGYLDSDAQATSLIRLPDASLLYNEATRSIRYTWSGPLENET